MKNQQRNSLDPASQTEVQARVADRLGFLLAKRWIRIHREMDEKKLFPRVISNKSNRSGKFGKKVDILAK